ncbi:MAG: hypothetical protein Q7R64_03565 [bacterium]|nr:hypothetical protein [bacterium]
MTSLTLHAEKPTSAIELHRSSRPLSLDDANTPTFFENARLRIDGQMESRLLIPLTIGYRLGQARENPFDLSASRGKSLFGDGLTYSLREWGLQTPAYAWLDERFNRVGGWFSAFWRDTLSGKVERNNTQSPAEFSFVEKRDRFYGIKKGLRPFSRNNPYAFLGYGLRDSSQELIFETTFRAYLRDWSEPTFSLVTEVPLGTWSFGFGIEGRSEETRAGERNRYGRFFPEADRRVDITLGLKGQVMGGLVSVGADVLGKRVVAWWGVNF